jgi:hypothetical protein
MSSLADLFRATVSGATHTVALSTVSRLYNGSSVQICANEGYRLANLLWAFIVASQSNANVVVLVIFSLLG